MDHEKIALVFKKETPFSLSFEVLILSGLLFFTISTLFFKTIYYFYLIIFYYFVIVYATKKLIETEYSKKKYLTTIVIIATLLFSFSFVLFLNNLNLNYFIETYKSLSHLILFMMFFSYFSIIFAISNIIIFNVIKTHKK
ncbi:MAG: hypothetical protein QXY70_00775 [Nanopusillaceae archaeon]